MVVSSVVTVLGVKPEQQSNLTPLKDRLTENNEKNVIENGVVSEQKMVTGNTEGDTNKYLHKKFKKVATLEETSPPKVRNEDDIRPGSPGAGRYVCPYCKLACAKPSVLQKHIRAHTNERPFPCLPCGFAFKTKSNLYKHCRSRAHTLKMDDGSSDEEDPSRSEVRVEVKNKIYKPKFHTATIYAEEQQPKLQLTIPPSSSSLSSQSTPSPFSGSSPSPEFVQRHINKLISDNQAIVDEVSWPLKPRYKDSPPTSPAPKNGDCDGASQSKLALALLRPSRDTTPEVGEPLNLTTKEPRKRSISDSVIKTEARNSDGSSKDFLLKTYSAGSLGERDVEKLLLCPNCRLTFKSTENLEIHLSHCVESKDGHKMLMLSPGPLLGNTPLVDGIQKDVGPLIKKRKLDLLPLRREEVLKSPGKSVHLFGGEVQINDPSGGRMKTLRIESSRKDVYVESGVKKQEQVLTISNTGLHCVGGTMIQTGSVVPAPKSPCHEKSVLPIKPAVVTPNLSVPGIVAPVQVPLALNPLTSITGFNPLTLPKQSPTNGGLVTILHGGKPIPYVPGMPGPQTLLPGQSVLVPTKSEKPSVIVKTTKSSELIAKVSPLIVKLDNDDRRDNEETKQCTASREPSSISNSETNEKKFLRPTSLPLKPGTYTPKRQLSTPHLTLVSPETPRPRKSYGQLYLNGHAYTYLGLKCSTRTFFCTLNKPQPIYVPLIPDQYKVSMYSNWKICSDSHPHPLGLEPRKAMSYYDSRNRSGAYCVANRNKEDLITHSSYQLKKDHLDCIRSDSDEKTESKSEGPCKRIKVCEGGFESNEDYIYVRGRGRGRYVCEECGIRCKKPSMLKKHIRTHTDLRPYTCKHCAFSFKTKGNLTKHMKSKAHYKKCVELGISPVPTVAEDCTDDENVHKMEDSQDRGSICDESEEDEEEEDEDDDDDDDEEGDESDEEEEGDDCQTEREVARSLLTLSEVTLETAHRKYVKAGLVPAFSKPRMYPYTFASTQVVESKSESSSHGESWRGSSEIIQVDMKDHSDSSLGSIESVPEPIRPIDLSSKTLPVVTLAGSKTPVITSVGGQALLLKTICSTSEKAPLVGGFTEPTDNPTLLHTYLTERAAHDSRIKQRQVCSDDGCSGDMSSAQESALGVLALSMSGKPPSPKPKGKAEFMPPSSGPSVSFISSTEDGRSMCGVCNKVFNKPSQLRLHVNIHFFERPFRCESCAVSFRTKGHLQKHQRSLSHLNKVNMNSTFGTATTSNPRPFKCDDCKIAFRIHGHLAKHLRSKMHIMKLECLGKLPFGTYAELERSGMNMNDIDTTDCENSLESLQLLAQKLYEKDPSKLGSWEPGGESSSEDEPDAQHKTDNLPQTPSNQNLCQPIEGNKCNPTDDSVR
ncbi:uncharacterized protein shn isoform X3 [Halyomorpha halys]|uniref:uncharacterized protein shn isoform X3 n=1 Tax=Halyomorpha halys TaxID=286706 RepID=UPI0006D4F733|nr:uncharacterized protein LOC106687976 isoform X3 [Halyomorpha halys]